MKIERTDKKDNDVIISEELSKREKETRMTDKHPPTESYSNPGQGYVAEHTGLIFREILKF